MRRVLVCGTNFGARYLAAIRRAHDRYQLAGILSRGSARSALLAARDGVPLFRDVTEVPAVDAAFAAMGASGEHVVLELLRRGIPVLCEHPVRPAFLEEALDTGALFHVNGHFASLQAPRAFLRALPQEQPLFIDAALTPRLLHGLFDILRHALADVEPQFAPPLRNGWFTTLSGTIGGIPATLQLEPLRPDDSAEVLIDCRIALGFPSGVITLLGLAGPVIRGLSEIVLADPFEEQRLEAIESAMDDLVRGNTPPEQTPEHLRGVSRAVDAVSRMLA